MAIGFDNLELSNALDDLALDITRRGNSDLVFGGSSEAEAEVFGAEIGKNDTVRFGAFQGGVALANLKTQEQRQLRFERIQTIQDELRGKRDEGLQRDRDAEDKRRSNRDFNENNRSALEAEKIARGNLKVDQDAQKTADEESKADILHDQGTLQDNINQTGIKNAAQNLDELDSETARRVLAEDSQLTQDVMRHMARLGIPIPANISTYSPLERQAVVDDLKLRPTPTPATGTGTSSNTSSGNPDTFDPNGNL